MALLSWFRFPITNPHGSDDGVDIGVPNDTPLTLPFGGTVIDTSYHDYGGQVVVDVPGTGYSEYFIHMDNINVQPGQQVQAGQQVGTSGGGVGDLVLHNGKVQPAQSQSWYDGHSSGYHTEYGMFEGDTMNDFNRGWGNHQRQLDPTGVLNDLQNGLEPHWPGTTPPSGNPTSQPTQGQTLSSSADWKDPNTWGPAIANGIASSFGFTGPIDMLQRVAVGGAGVAVILIGLYVAVQPEADAAAGVAAKAALL